MSSSSRKRTKRLTVCAMLSALGVVLLGLGSLIESIDLTTAALASILCVYAVIEMNGSYPWMIWGVTALLAFILLPQKTPAIFYLFIGCYPMLKEKLEKLPRIPCLILKLVIFHVMLLLGYLLLRVFVPAETVSGTRWLIPVTYVLGVATFLLYDLALTRLITYYLVRLRNRLGLK